MSTKIYDTLTAQSKIHPNLLKQLLEVIVAESSSLTSFSLLVLPGMVDHWVLKNIAIVVSFSILTLLHLCQRLLVTQCRSFSVDNITVISSSPWATTINKKNNNININFNNNTDNNTVMSYSPWTLWGSTVSLNSTVITMSQSSSDHQWYFDLKQAAKKSQQVTNGKNYQPLNYWFITN